MASHHHVLKFEAFPERSLTLALYSNVENAQEIRALIMAGEFEPEFAYLHAPAVADVFTVHVGAQKALTAEARGSLSARSLHAELIFCVSGSKHIGESLKRYGISDESTSILAARFDASPDDMNALDRLVKGTSQPLEQLSSYTDEALIQKYCKFSKEEMELGGFAAATVARICAKDCL